MPINSLDPDALKASARQAIAFNGAQPLRHQGVLNAIAQAFGAHGGWSGYPEVYKGLRAFLRRHDARDWRDLHVPRNLVNVRSLGRRALADRLFDSGEPAPHRLCLGPDFDWWSIAPVDQYSGQHPIYAGGVAAAGTNWTIDLFMSWNLLGDALVDPMGDLGLPVQLYFPNAARPEDVKIERDRAAAAARYMRGVLESEPDAFIDVLPFNDRVFVLLGPDGTYDIVFRDCRDGPPSQFMTTPCVDLQDVPSALLLNSRFNRWFYQQRGVWEEAEEHAAEAAFYRSGGTVQTYPENVLERHYIATGRYSPPVGSIRESAKAPESMTPVERPDGATLWVSDLVTVGEFNAFLAKTGYLDRRARVHENEWDSDLTIANGALSDDQPAAMTGFDAWAYCAFMERELNLPIRLLSIAEYRFLRRDLPGREFRPRPGDWDAPNPTVPLPDDLVFETSPDGIRFAVHTNIGEWLLERWNRNLAAIDTGTLTSARAPTAVDRDAFVGRSWGRYKRTRIGLRLCFEAPAAWGA